MRCYKIELNAKKLGQRIQRRHSTTKYDYQLNLPEEVIEERGTVSKAHKHNIDKRTTSFHFKNRRQRQVDDLITLQEERITRRGLEKMNQMLDGMGSSSKRVTLNSNEIISQIGSGSKRRRDPAKKGKSRSKVRKYRNESTSQLPERREPSLRNR